MSNDNWLRVAFVGFVIAAACLGYTWALIREMKDDES